MPCVYDDVPGSWGSQSTSWPYIDDADGSARRLVIREKLVPYGSYVTVGNQLRLETKEYVERVRIAMQPSVPQAAPVPVEGERWTAVYQAQWTAEGVWEDLTREQFDALEDTEAVTRILYNSPPEQPAVELDAARYRWLRDAAQTTNFDTPRWTVAHEYGGMGRTFRGNELDAAIDAAIARVGEGNTRAAGDCNG